jgi:hypothetical protein
MAKAKLDIPRENAVPRLAVTPMAPNRAKKQNSDRVEPIRPKSVRNFDTALANRVFGLPSFVLPSLFRIVFAKVPIAATEAQHMPGIYRATHFSNITDASTITEVRSNITALDIIKDVVLLPMCDFWMEVEVDIEGPALISLSWEE